LLFQVKVALQILSVHSYSITENYINANIKSFNQAFDP